MRTIAGQRLGYSKYASPVGTPFVPKFAALSDAQAWILSELTNPRCELAPE